MKSVTRRTLVLLLESLISDAINRPRIIKEFSELGGNFSINDCTAQQRDTILDLIVDLSYYSEDPEALAEEPSLYGYERLQVEVRQALEVLAPGEKLMGSE